MNETQSQTEEPRSPIRVNFAPSLVPLVQSGEKNTTWRIGDEKDFRVGDDLILWMKGKNEKGEQIEADKPFGRAKAIRVWEKPFKDFTAEEKTGYEPFLDDDTMIETYRRYYGPQVSKDTIVKIIKFELVSQ